MRLGIPRIPAKTGVHEAFAYVGQIWPMRCDFMAMPLKSAHGRIAMLLHSK